MKKAFALLLATAASVAAGTPVAPGISGDYLEVRSCNVFTGSCVANSEMGLTGKEGILVWSIRQGAWNGVALDGLKVIAVVETGQTLGNLRAEPRVGKAVLIVDEKADANQKSALAGMVRSLAGGLIGEVAAVKTSAMDVSIGECAMAGCAKVKAGNLVEVATRCIGGKDHLCGNEETYYPPLTDVEKALPVFTEIASYKGGGLNTTWESVGMRSAFLASFSR